MFPFGVDLGRGKSLISLIVGWLWEYKDDFSGFLAPLAVGQQAYVMVRCASVCLSVFENLLVRNHKA